MPDPSSYLRRFLNVYWLRPENALWRSINCQTIHDLQFDEPSIDLSCGDGIFSFLRAGGDFDLSFDIFSGVGGLEEFYKNKDIYDAAPAEYAPKVATAPRYRMTVGADWKQNLLDKAAPLNFYRDLVVHDNNEPLSFADGEFKTIFSNSVYWIRNLDLHLREIRRVLHPEGQAVLVLKTTQVNNYTLDRFESYVGREWLELIERGRKANKPSLHDADGWERVLREAGFQIRSRREQVTWLHAHIWDIGLRPLTPVLCEMTAELTEQRRAEIKSHWLDIWERLLAPFNRPEADLGMPQPQTEVIFVLGR